MKKAYFVGCAAAAALVTAAAITSLHAHAKAAQPGFEQIGRLLVEGIRSTPGCLGVETAQTSSGKNVIFAWFKDKESALAWHSHPMHRRMMSGFFADRPEGHIPMEHIPDGAGPLLVIASLKPADKPLPGTRMPISEIAIETYMPMPGGLRINGGFTPASVEVPHRQLLNTNEAAPPEQDQQPAETR